MVNGFSEKVDFIWSIAGLLRGDYKQSEYQKVVLPLTVLRRLDFVTDPTKEAGLARAAELEEQGIENVGPLLKQTWAERLQHERVHVRELCDDPDDVAGTFPGLALQ